MLVKIHKSSTSEIVVVCDEDLIGKTLEDKKIKIVVTERFYKGEKKSDTEIILILKEAKNINLLGKNTINLAIKNGIIKESNVVKIKGIPHAQALSF